MSSSKTLVILAGTRPEIIKQVPLLWAAAASDRWNARFVATGQHRDLGEQILSDLGVTVDRSLNLMTAAQSPTEFLGHALQAIGPLLAELRPDWVAVQGDTTTALAGAIAAFYARVPVLHVEAGLRTHNLSLPFPEEGHRQLITRVTSAHAAPTETAAAMLRQENVPARQIRVTGNTGIDCLLRTASRLNQAPTAPSGLPAELRKLDQTGDAPLVFVTMHRRESFGAPLRGMCSALARAADQFPQAQFVLPVHPNPAVREIICTQLAGRPNFHLVEPLAYTHCVWLMNRASFIVTDSGGLQEEGPALGKPVLVLRDVTERPEAVECGAALLIGCAEEQVYTAVARFLAEPDSWLDMAAPRFPYGDGNAAPRILEWLESGF